EILISESAWEEMTCLFAPSLDNVQPFLNPENKSVQLQYFFNSL
ncbi:dibenzothiophene desulfurase, partial [Enterobacter hormaechei]